MAVPAGFTAIAAAYEGPASNDSSSVAGSHYRNFFSTKEKSIANGAGAYAITVESFFTFKAEPFGGGARCNNYRIGCYKLFFINPNFKRLL